MVPTKMSGFRNGERHHEMLDTPRPSGQGMNGEEEEEEEDEEEDDDDDVSSFHPPPDDASAAL